METKLFDAVCDLSCEVECGWVGTQLVPNLFTEAGITYGEWFCPECDAGHQGTITLSDWGKKNDLS